MKTKIMNEYYFCMNTVLKSLNFDLYTQLQIYYKIKHLNYH